MDFSWIYFTLEPMTPLPTSVMFTDRLTLFNLHFCELAFKKETRINNIQIITFIPRLASIVNWRAVVNLPNVHSS